MKLKQQKNENRSETTKYVKFKIIEKKEMSHHDSKSSGDGTSGISSQDERNFLKWLKTNGATFPKIEWYVRSAAYRSSVYLSPNTHICHYRSLTHSKQLT